MDKHQARKLDEIRAERTELENHYIDELVAGRLDRRQFLRRGSMIGMSTTLLGTDPGGVRQLRHHRPRRARRARATTSGPAPTAGGTLNVGSVTPSAAINPLTVADAGGLVMLNQTGEFLIFDSNLKLALQPMLALSWGHNGDGSVWTFKLRPGVKFSTGAPMTADDVVYTFKQLSDPKNALQRAVDVHRRADPRRRQEDRLDDGPVHARGAERELPVSGLVGQLQRDHRSQRDRLRQMAEDVRRHGRVQASELHAERRRVVRAQPQLLGQKAAAGGHVVQVLRQPAADDPRAAGQLDRRDHAVRPRRRDRDPPQPVLQDHPAQVGKPPRAVDAQRPAAVQ